MGFPLLPTISFLASILSKEISRTLSATYPLDSSRLNRIRPAICNTILIVESTLPSILFVHHFRVYKNGRPVSPVNAAWYATSIGETEVFKIKFWDSVLFKHQQIYGGACQIAKCRYVIDASAERYGYDHFGVIIIFVASISYSTHKFIYICTAHEMNYIQLQYTTHQLKQYTYRRNESRKLRHRNTSSPSWEVSNGTTHFQIWYTLCRYV